MPEISVIVPIYNSGKYLMPCLDSMLSQTFADFELICIDDFSEDNSSIILSQYAEKDKRVQVFHNEKHLGAAKTRNRGIGMAKGNYLVFWDADELYVSDLLEKLITSAQKYDADLVLAERGIIQGEAGFVAPERSNRFEYDGYDKRTFTLLDLPKEGLTMWPSSPVNRMVKKTLIKEQHLEYQDLPSSNDVLFADMTMILANRIVHIQDWTPKIHVRRNIPGSISNNRNPFCSYEAFKEIKRQLKEKKSWEEYQHYVLYQFASSVRSELIRCKNEEIRKKYYEFVKKEGLFNFCEDSGIKYLLLKTNLSFFVNNILEYPYEMNCWELTQMSEQLRDNRERLERLILFFRENGFKVALWGAGKWGKEVAKYLEDNFHYKFDSIVDNNRELWGKLLNEVEITSFERVKDNIDIFVITNMSFRDGIKEQMRKSFCKAEILMLPQYLGKAIVECLE